MATRKEEYQSCVSLITWWQYAHKGLGVPECLLVHVPNQAGGNPRTGMHLKKMGVRAGMPDYMLLVTNSGGYKGLFIEMKSRTGRVRPEQVQMGEALKSQGYAVSLCRSAMEARDVIEDYIHGKLKRPA